MTAVSDGSSSLVCQWCDGGGEANNPLNADPNVALLDWHPPVICPRCNGTGKDPVPKPIFPPESNADKVISTIDLARGAYGSDYAWQVRSTCGVVKVWSSRDGCMLAMNSTQARLLARELSEALEDAASSVDRASRGGKR